MSTPGADRRDGYWFGSFDGACKSVPLPLCQLVGFPAGQGSTPAVCYNRNTEVFGQIVLLPSTVAVYFVSFIMFVIIIWHVKSKYTAVGRKEMAIFFYLCLLTFFVEFLLTTGAIAAASVAYTHVTAAHVGLISATFLCLLVNGLISFQIIEDGTAKSVWLVRLSAAFVFAVAYLVALDTFSGIIRFFDRANPTGLWVVYFVLNGGFLAIYIVLQIFLVLRMLDSRWPLGDVLIAVTFFVISYLVLFAFGTDICEYTDHYVDGFFFGTLLNLLAILMVYKYWDSITSEDLEFAVDSDGRNWEVREDAALACEIHPDAALYFDEPVAAARSPHLSFVVAGGARTAASSVYAPDLPFGAAAAAPPPFASPAFASPAAEKPGIDAYYRGQDPFPAPFRGFDQRQSGASAPVDSGGGAGAGWRPVPPSLRSTRSFTSAHSPSPRSGHSPSLRSARSPSLRSPSAYADLFPPSPGRSAGHRQHPDDFEPFPPGHNRASAAVSAPPSIDRAKELPPSPRSKDLPPNRPPATF